MTSHEETKVRRTPKQDRGARRIAKILDAAALKIVEMAGPYAPFPPDIRNDTDILYITRTWSFTRAGELESSAAASAKAP